MPIYDFMCTECGKEFERITSSTVQTLECPLCGAGANKQISAPAKPKFNGSGFYETDFKSK